MDETWVNHFQPGAKCFAKMLPAETLSVREILSCLDTLRAYLQTNTQRHEIGSGGI